MKVIYYDYGGAHSSVVAACVHTGVVAPSGRPALSEIAVLPRFDRAAPPDRGRLTLAGVDQDGVEVYVVGCGRFHCVAGRALRGVALALGVPAGDLVMVNTLPAVNPLMRIGGFLSRQLGLVFIGRPIVVLGTWLAFPKIAALVEKARRTAGRTRKARPVAAAGAAPAVYRPGVLYHCFGSAHSSVVASAMHVGLLPTAARPTPAELLALPHFDRVTSRQLGTVFHIGRSPEGREVYIVGLAGGKRVLTRAIGDLLAAFGLPDDALPMADSIGAASVVTRVGGMLSRRWGFIRLGRPLVVAGVLREYPTFVRLVGTVRRRLSLDGDGNVVDNEQ
jgi:hypothetical protein